MIFAKYFEMARLDVADLILVPGFSPYFKRTEGFISDGPIPHKARLPAIAASLLNNKQQEDFLIIRTNPLPLRFRNTGDSVVMYFGNNKQLLSDFAI